MGFTHKHLHAFFSLALFLLVLGLWATLALARPFHHPNAMSLRERHQLWMRQHGRVYESEHEKEKRFNIFKHNIEYIYNFNNNASSHNLFKLSINAFADLSTKEFVATRTGNMKLPTQNDTSSSYAMPNKEWPKNLANGGDTSYYMDWRERGAVTRVKDQGQCGSCWAFSTVATVEGLYKIKRGRLLTLTEQELLDCVAYNGCNGVSIQDAFSFIIKNHGISTEYEYPYKAYQGRCRGGNDGVFSFITGYYQLPRNDEWTLLRAVWQQPVSVVVDASGNDFMYYGGGVFNGNCGTEQNHAVTLVGYGTDRYGTDYWLVKNSWGESWGEGGYMRIIRDRNQCGIALNAIIPTTS